MTEKSSPQVGSIWWFDLTVKDAPALRDFYCEVVGWSADALSMREYDDYGMSRNQQTARPWPASATPSCRRSGSST